MRSLAAIVLAAVLLASCSGSDITQAEYDQKITDLALAQQELLTARDRISVMEDEMERAAATTNQLTDRITALLREAGGIADAGIDPVDQMDALINDLRTQVDALMIELEERVEATGEGAAETDGAARLDAYLGLISLWAASWDGAAPPREDVLADLVPEANRALDMELLTALDNLIAAAGNLDEHLAFIQNVTDWARQVAAGGRPPG